MKQLGFVREDADPCLFMKGQVLMGLHVDDGLLVGPEKEVTAAVRQIAGRFTIKDEGFVTPDKVSVFLGVEMQLIPGKGLLLKQERYTNEILKKFKMDDMGPSPIIMREQKQTGEKPVEGNNPFASMVGALLYLATHTRPDICYAVAVLARKMTKATKEDLKDAMQVFMYLNKYPAAGILLPVKKVRQTKPGFVIYSDASFCEKPKSKSTSGMMVMYNGAPISWQSKLQSIVATSTCEAEYIAASTAVQEGMWLRKLTADIQGKTAPIPLYVDNEAAIKLASDDAAYATGRTKHIDLKYHYVQDHVMKKEVLPKFVTTDLQLADAMTKILSVKKHKELMEKIGMIFE